MSYVPQPTAYGGAYGGVQASPYLDAKVIETQRLDATGALTNQHKLQTDMLTHQYDAQKLQLKAEFERNVTMAKQQFKQQTMQLDMARQQRDMMISTQAAQMTADATQHQLQIDMQNKMANLYSTGLAGAAGAKPAAAKPAAKPAAPKPK